MSRSTKEGWINTYRKPFLVINVVVFVAAWLFMSPLYPLSASLVDLLEGFGSLFVVIGVIGRIYSSLTIASHKNREVVTTEMYSVVRHPLYFFSFFLVLGVGLLTGRLDLLLYLVVVYGLCFYPMIINEERHLTETFAAAYSDYAKRTPRIIPDFSKWTAREKMDINLKLVTKTMLDAGLVLLIIPAIEIVEYLRNL